MGSRRYQLYGSCSVLERRLTLLDHVSCSCAGYSAASYSKERAL